MPLNVSVGLVRTRAGGLDFAIISGTRRNALRRARRIMTETDIFPKRSDEENGSRIRMTNNLYAQWVPWMNFVGFKLRNAPPLRKEVNETDVWIAEWVRDDISL